MYPNFPLYANVAHFQFYNNFFIVFPIAYIAQIYILEMNVIKGKIYFAVIVLHFQQKHSDYLAEHCGKLHNVTIQEMSIS